MRYAHGSSTVFLSAHQASVYHVILWFYSAEDNLAKVQGSYGSGSCFLLRINSRKPDSVVLGDNPWSHVASQYSSVNSAGVVGHVILSVGCRENKVSLL